MDEKILQALKSSNPETRKAAIKNMVYDHELEAIPLLGEVSRNDPDPEIRELAVKARVLIKQKLGAGGKRQVKQEIMPDQADKAWLSVRALVLIVLGIMLIASFFLPLLEGDNSESSANMLDIVTNRDDIGIAFSYSLNEMWLLILSGQSDGDNLSPRAITYSPVLLVFMGTVQILGGLMNIRSTFISKVLWGVYFIGSFVTAGVVFWLFIKIDELLGIANLDGANYNTLDMLGIGFWLAVLSTILMMILAMSGLLSSRSKDQ